jgi:hypothetical protein
MLHLKDLRARIARLEQLSRGLSLEEMHWRKADAPVLSAERDAYRAALHRAVHAVEEARLVLVRACQRVEEFGDFGGAFAAPRPAGPWGC